MHVIQNQPDGRHIISFSHVIFLVCTYCRVPSACAVICGEQKYRRTYTFEVVDSLLRTVVVLSAETHGQKCDWMKNIETFFTTDHVDRKKNIKTDSAVRRCQSESDEALKRNREKNSKAKAKITWESGSDSNDYQMLPILDLND